MTNKTPIYNSLILLPYYWMVTGLVFIPRADRIMVALIAISAIASVSQYGMKVIKENLKQNKLFWLILLTSIYVVFSYYYHGISGREVRGFFSLVVFLCCFPRELLTQKLLCLLAITGSMITFFTSFYSAIILDIPRSTWVMNAIPFATIAATFSLLSLNLLAYTKNKKIKAMLLIAVTLSLTGLILSQSRGPLFAFIVVFLCNMIFLFRGNSFKFLIPLITTLIVVAPFIYPQIEQRVTQTQNEITAIGSGYFNTSIGLRLSMIMATPDMIKGDLLIGSGDMHREKITKLAKEGKVFGAFAHNPPPHYHNQYIDKLIKTGIIGLLLFLAILIIPLTEFNKRSRLSFSIITAIVILFTISGLTDAPFNHGQTLCVFIFIMNLPNYFSTITENN